MTEAVHNIFIPYDEIYRWHISANFRGLVVNEKSLYCISDILEDILNDVSDQQ